MTEKPWGFTEIVFANQLIELHKITVKPKGFSSIHLHQNKSNIFSIIQGDLKIYTYNPEKVQNLDEANSCTEIKENTKHRFYSETGAIAYEIYYSREAKHLSVNDIIRFS